MSTETRVRDHFHLDAHRFDAIYEEGKNPLDRFIDHVWRGVVRRRFDITLDKLEPVRGRSILDVGCGSGRYGLALAARGARRILGVDFAPAMIDLARQLAERAGVSEACEFRVGAFPADVPNERFDAAIALGFFDYVPNPADLVRAMRECTTGKLVMSFPKAWEWRVPIRRLRFLAAGCPLFLYSGAQVKRVLSDAGVTRYECIELDRDYLIIAQV